MVIRYPPAEDHHRLVYYCMSREAASQQGDWDTPAKATCLTDEFRLRSGEFRTLKEGTLLLQIIIGTHPLETFPLTWNR